MWVGVERAMQELVTGLRLAAAHADELPHFEVSLVDAEAAGTSPQPAEVAGLGVAQVLLCLCPPPRC